MGMPYDVDGPQRMRSSAIVALSIAWFAVDPARADALCVVCADPPATYRCIAEDDTGVALAAGDRASTLACVTELAQRHRHASCLVRRDATTACDAPTRRVSVIGAGERPAAAPNVAATVRAPATGAIRSTAPDPAAAPSDAPRPPANPDAPKTMVEVAKRTADASDRELNKAGSAVTSTVRSAGDALSKTGKAMGDAVTTTFGCIVSLFQRCGG